MAVPRTMAWLLRERPALRLRPDGSLSVWFGMKYHGRSPLARIRLADGSVRNVEFDGTPEGANAILDILEGFPREYGPEAPWWTSVDPASWVARSLMVAHKRRWRPWLSKKTGEPCISFVASRTGGRIIVRAKGNLGGVDIRTPDEAMALTVRNLMREAILHAWGVRTWRQTALLFWLNTKTPTQ